MGTLSYHWIAGSPEPQNSDRRWSSRFFFYNYRPEGTGRKKNEYLMVPTLSKLCAMPLGFIGNMGVGEIIFLLLPIVIIIVVSICIIYLLNKKKRKEGKR